jgi:hypothetical protein
VDLGGLTWSFSPTGETVEEGEILKKIVSVSTEATALIFDKASEKLAHTGGPRG